ncbi:Tyrosine-protein kinase YwqD [Lacunisphaera limnophila]|uniref:Tyrosine-protein kinase YwqD n=1 Tax=Lacunisphaera limnophila TaxID=1838286 RepID=A0A1D8AWD4_9BACT|nr:polysaccharide biosynthesis tyrosine autokinase [Lacunisphaera limnophila]AOS45193.1 Tyrosine-protein kinase YwqD [Lacunisphaera limnophila]
MPTLPSTKDSATLGDFVGLLRLRKGLIFLVLGLVLLTTLGVTALLPKWYLSTAKISVQKPESEVKLFQAQSNTYYDPYFIQDQFRIIQAEKILYPVIESLGLNEILGKQLNDGVALPSAITYRYLISKMLRVEAPRASSIIEIDVYARDQRLAADIANAIARVYAEDRITLATSDQREGLAQLRKELDKQELAVTTQRDHVEKLRKELDIAGVDLSQRYSDMDIETLRQMQNSLIALRVDAIGRKTRWERFRNIPAADRRNLVNSELIQDTNIQNLLQAYLISDQTVTRLMARLGAAHPDLIAAIDNSAKIQQQLDSQLRGYESSLEMAFKEAEARVTELERQLAQAKVDQILSARERMRPFEEATGKLDDEQRLLTTLKLTLRQREIDFQVPKKTIEILNTAEPARFASRPNWPLNILFACVFGTILGVGAAVLLEYFDTSFRNVADVEGKLSLPVLGVIPHMAEAGELHDPSSPEGEPYRVLQTNLNLALTAGKTSVLVVLSSGPGEGKSTTLRQLALCMAAAGEKVLLIDSDVRRPTQHKLAGLSRDPGLTDIVLNKVPWTAAVVRDKSGLIDFIPAGAAANNVTLGLLYATKLKALVEEFRGRYDKVLFDSPPIIGVSDASVLASLADGIVLLIQHRRNPESMVQRAKQIIDGLKVPVIGVVLNQVPTGTGEDYSYYTNNYSYYSHEKPVPGAAGAAGPNEARGSDRIEMRETREPERKR